jgi:hypothetical protein
MGPEATAMTLEADGRSKEELVAAYKEILQSYIDHRPSGKHKSFVSQITNPAYPVPVPARHVNSIMDICHFSPEERSSFLAAYGAAHPNQARDLEPALRRGGARHSLHIEVPVFEDARVQQEVESAIRDFARRLIAIAGRRGG